jgi:dTDP-4-amino-4,6-dideoxygalactose transaminase
MERCCKIIAMPNIERSQPILSPMTTAQKKKRFRELARQDWIRTASQFAEELEQPFLPFNEFKVVVSLENRADAFRLTRRAVEVEE